MLTVLVNVSVKYTADVHRAASWLNFTEGNRVPGSVQLHKNKKKPETLCVCWTPTKLDWRAGLSPE